MPHNCLLNSCNAVPMYQILHLGKQKIRKSLVAPESSKVWVSHHLSLTCLYAVRDHWLPPTHIQALSPCHLSLPPSPLTFTATGPQGYISTPPRHARWQGRACFFLQLYTHHLGPTPKPLCPSSPTPSSEMPSGRTTAASPRSSLPFSGVAMLEPEPHHLALDHFLIDQRVCLPLSFPSSRRAKAVTSFWVPDM